MSYLDQLKEHLGETDPTSTPPKPPKPSFSGSGGSPGGHIPPVEAMRLVRLALGALDAERPLHGLTLARWNELREDAGWITDAFAPAAFHNGWTVGELFGLWWWREPGGALSLKPGWGGVADRIQRARSLVMTADSATWRPIFGREPETFNRTAYPDLKPLWEPGQ